MPEVHGDYGRLILKSQLAGWPDQVNVWGFRIVDADSPLAEGDAASIANAFEVQYAAKAARFSTGWSILSMDVIDFNTASTPGYTYASAVVGTAADAMLPPDTAACIALKTGLRGKSFRGRVFVGGATEVSSTATGEIEDAHVSALEDLVADLVVAMQGLGFPLSVISTHSGVDGDGKPIPRATAVVTPITSGVCNKIWDRQKRRSRR